MAVAQDLTGRRFGRLVVLERGPVRNGKRDYAVRCDCGWQFTTRGSCLTGGTATSCGCRAAEINRARLTRHGHRGSTPSATYISWRAMIQRCTYPKNEKWPDYGGRGITVCVAWLVSFEQFLADLGERPAGMTLDRIDVNGNYEPGNVRWSTAKDQRGNQRSTRATA